MKYLQVSSMREEQALLGNAILISITTADIWQIASTRQKQTTNQQILIAPDSDFNSNFNWKIYYTSQHNRKYLFEKIMATSLCFSLPVLILFLLLCPYKNNFSLIIKTKRFVHGQKLIHNNLMQYQAFGGWQILRSKSKCRKHTPWPQKNPFYILLFTF